MIEDIGTLPGLERAPWSSRYLQGLIDVPYLNLTPSRLYVKELVLKNFRGLPAEQLIDGAHDGALTLCRGEIETRLMGCNAPCDWMEAWSPPRPLLWLGRHWFGTAVPVPATRP